MERQRTSLADRNVDGPKILSDFWDIGSITKNDQKNSIKGEMQSAMPRLEKINRANLSVVNPSNLNKSAFFADADEVMETLSSNDSKEDDKLEDKFMDSLRQSQMSDVKDSQTGKSKRRGTALRKPSIASPNQLSKTSSLKLTRRNTTLPSSFNMNELQANFKTMKTNEFNHKITNALNQNVSKLRQSMKEGFMNKL